VQRHALAVLFTALALAFVAVAAAAFLGADGSATRWIVGFAALALGAWLGSLATSLFRRS